MTAPNPPLNTPLPAWERRFRAGRIGLPDWAVEAPERCSVVATHQGVLEMHSWQPGGPLVQLTSRREGTALGEIDPSGEWIWWFDDAAGNEHGIWRRQPFGSAPGSDEVAVPGLAPSYSAGLALGPDELAVIGQNDDGYGTRIQVQEKGKALRLLYEHEEDAGVGGLSEDGTLVAIAHSEHGDSRHTALRVLRVADGSTVADLWDGPGKSLEPLGFAPLAGDPRLLVLHERRGRGELLIWDVQSGLEVEVNLDVPGEISQAQWFRDAATLLISVDHQARTRLYTFSLIDLSTQPAGPSDGTVLEATTRPDGKVWALWSSAAQPAAVRDLEGEMVLAPPGEPAPPSVTIEDVWVEGPGGRIHALLRRPTSATGPLPMVIDIHGGPTAHDGDYFRAYPSAWVDHGFALLQVNYRGSTGYGSQWRDALEKRVGHIELEDVVAVRDHLVETGIAAPDQVVLAGASWGGYLTLLGLGLYPDRWAVGVAGVPVADYLAAYEDEMEALKAFDRSLFGGSPEEVPDKYRDSSPITYADRVVAPVLVLAGENDPRCPIRQIENYVAVLAERGAEHEVYRYDAGHGSLVDDERVRQVRAEIDFVKRHLNA
ncbi:prolyl oligopeptidase family serine peptidase [Kineosporia rhizophila]|uniref:S9 family peptidase n=1 Tax=Kineosporia TaxID=49184 RepID=UPI001E4CC5E7|nr:MULTISPECIES: prolyl oligopeptidase family serine peptidase [Kineosporia]MCE0536140.1 prolyl oligopeptidase family serine peptidase [Kineosporia rhizophila]GLY14124.1 peptide hydrolase [Kineosporia sp. NBRC 101677]